MMTAADFAELIDEARCSPSGEWAGLCPAHEDTDPSLTWRDGDKGLVLDCHKGCTFDAVCRAAKVPPSALFRDPPGQVADPIIATYDYVDERGTVLFQVVRTALKKFWQRRPRPDGEGWVNDVKGARRILHHLDRIQGQTEVAIVEGEKDADRLWTLGIPATTNPMGAGKWRAEYTEQLVAAGVTRVWLFADNDQAGVAHADDVARACTAAGIAVYRVHLPDLPPVRAKHGEDVSDWLDAGHTAEALRALMAAAPVVEPAADGAPTPDSPRAKVTFRAGTALDATPLTYVVGDMIPAGMLAALGGKDGMGKTLLTMLIIRSVLTGLKLFGQFAVQQGHVYALFLDDPEFLVRERLAALGILDHPNLHVATEQTVDMADPQAMLTALIALLKAADPKPVLVVVDALYLFIPSGGTADKGNSAGAMGPVVKAFNQVTRETGSALLLVVHDNKGGSDIAGSYAIRAGCKAILRLLFPPAIALRVAKGDEEARETPERMLQLNKLKTGRPTSWYLRLDGSGQWTFYGDSRAYRAATLPNRVIESLWGRGESTVDEIATDLRARPSEVRAACITLFLADQITRGERPREDGKAGRDAVIYGPKAATP